MTKPFLFKMGCEISGWRFSFFAGFYCIDGYLLRLAMLFE